MIPELREVIEIMLSQNTMIENLNSRAYSQGLRLHALEEAAEAHGWEVPKP